MPEASTPSPSAVLPFTTMHGYTYSGHPVAAAAGIATLKVYTEESTFEQSRSREGGFEQLLHGLRDEPNVIDIRNCGLMGGIDLASRPGAPGARGMDVFLHCWQNGVVIRASGDTLAIAPFFATTDSEFEQLFSAVRNALRSVS